MALKTPNPSGGQLASTQSPVQFWITLEAGEPAEARIVATALAPAGINVSCTGQTRRSARGPAAQSRNRFVFGLLVVEAPHSGVNPFDCEGRADITGRQEPGFADQPGERPRKPEPGFLLFFLSWSGGISALLVPERPREAQRPRAGCVVEQDSAADWWV